MNPITLNRREFVGYSLALTLAGCATNDAPVDPAGSAHPQKVVTLDDVFTSYLDESSGARIYNLTPDAHSNRVVYQTHPMWSPRLQYLLFSSDRSGGGMRPHALDMASGEVRPVTAGAVDAFALSPTNGLLFYVQDEALYRIPLDAAYVGAAAPAKVGMLPENAEGVSGGISVDANNRTVYIGLKLADAEQWGIVSMDGLNGEGRGVTVVDFEVGHVQANPWQIGDIMFCHETGGDAPQRMWCVRANGADLMPFYREHDGQWVTHECWWGKDRAIFTIWPYDDAQKEQPHGVAVASRGSATCEILAQYPAWHTQGSPDGTLAVGDDFARNLWLIDVVSKEHRVLTGGHNTPGVDSHPHASFTPDGRGIVFTSSKNGNEQLFLIEIPEWDSLKT